MPRKNTQDAVRRFNAREESPAGVRGSAIWTDGRSIWSYATCLVTRQIDGSLIVNDTTYSTTTTIQQRGLAVLLTDPVAGRVDGIYRGSGPDVLRAVHQNNLTAAALAATTN